MQCQHQNCLQQEPAAWSDCQAFQLYIALATCCLTYACLFIRGEWDPKDPHERLLVLGRYISEDFSGVALHPVDLLDASTGRLVAQLIDPNLETICPVNKPHPRLDLIISGSSRSLYAWKPVPQGKICLLNNRQLVFLTDGLDSCTVYKSNSLGTFQVKAPPHHIQAPLGVVTCKACHAKNRQMQPDHRATDPADP